MTETWRSKPRRKVRSAPESRPAVAVPEEFRHSLEGSLGKPFAERVLDLFPGGALPATPKQFHAFEASLRSLLLKEAVAPILFGVVHALHDNEDFVLWSMGAARRRAHLRVTKDRPVTIQVTGGSVRLESPYMAPCRPKGKRGPKRKAGRRGKGGGGLYPVLAALGFVKKVSPLVASEVAESAARLCSFDEAARALKRQSIDMDPDTVRKITNAVADAGLAERESDEPLDDSLAGERVVLCIDGGRLRSRRPKGGTRLPSGFHGFHTDWIEPKVIAAYVVGDKGERTPDIRPVYEATLVPWTNAIEVFAKTLRRHGIQDAGLVQIAADGSDHIWRDVDRLVELLGVEPDRVVKVLDFWHAVEHMHDAAKLSTTFNCDQSREAWVTKRVELLRSGRAEEAIAQLLALPTTDEDAPKLAREGTYFTDRLHLLRYDEVAALGLPVGTGAVESAIRRIVNLRPKAPSTFWCAENTERMLYLRCRAKAERWHEVEGALHRGALVPERVRAPAVLEAIS